LLEPRLDMIFPSIARDVASPTDTTERLIFPYLHGAPFATHRRYPVYLSLRGHCATIYYRRVATRMAPTGS